MNFNKIIIWGYKPPMKHTHHSIHYAFNKAFKALGHNVLWLDDNDDVSNLNFDHCLFFTEGQVDKNIPINKSSKYILHNCNGEKYADISIQNKLIIQFFHKDVLNYNLQKINEYTYFGDHTLYQPWATDLLPHEIDLNQAKNEMSIKECVWVGSYHPTDRTEFENNTQLDPFFNECKKHGINLKHIDPWTRPVSFEENKKLINSAYLAPAIVGAFQKRTYYISCRIFKNISYGHLGITNSEFVNKIFNNDLIYDSDPAALFYKAIDKKNDVKCIKYIQDLMQEVKDKHTFINRANQILELI